MAAKEYPDFIESTGYGTGDGLCGWNCRHHFQAWDLRLRNPYVDENGNPKIDTEENRKRYELSQHQRSMERTIRKTKRLLVAKQAQMAGLDGEDLERLRPEYDKLAYDLTRQNRAYNDFCRKNGLQPQYERNRLADFGREQEKSANKGARRYKSENLLKNSAGQDIIRVSKTRQIAEPNSITQVTNAKGGSDRNFYGNDGRQTLQISNNGHGHKYEEKLGKHGEHAHDYVWDSDGNMTRSRGRELKDSERSDNNDFL